jgi:hypothetical protein
MLIRQQQRLSKIHLGSFVVNPTAALAAADGYTRQAILYGILPMAV